MRLTKIKIFFFSILSTITFTTYILLKIQLKIYITNKPTKFKEYECRESSNQTNFTKQILIIPTTITN